MAEIKSEKPNFFVRLGKGIVKWGREMRSELKKVVWPTPKQLLNSTVVVLVTVLIVGAIMSVFSYAAQQAVAMLISLAQ